MSGAEISGTSVSASARAAVTDLFGLHYRRLVGLAGLLVDDRDTSEDVVQEAFEKLYRHSRWLRDPQAAVTYLNRSVVNGSRSKRRRGRTERPAALPEAGSVAADESAGIDAEQRMTAALFALPRRQREVLVLRYYLDLSDEQIAEWLGVSRGSVEQHAARATSTLQSRMGALS